MTTDSTTTTATPTADLPPSEMLMSLTGFDETAIAVHFGEKITTLRHDAITGGRALVFAWHRRHRTDLISNDAEAFKAAQALTIREVTEFFAPEPKGDDDNSDAEGNA